MNRERLKRAADDGDIGARRELAKLNARELIKPIWCFESESTYEVMKWSSQIIKRIRPPHHGIYELTMLAREIESENSDYDHMSITAEIVKAGTRERLSTLAHARFRCFHLMATSVTLFDANADEDTEVIIKLSGASPSLLEMFGHKRSSRPVEVSLKVEHLSWESAIDAQERMYRERKLRG